MSTANMGDFEAVFAPVPMPGGLSFGQDVLRVL